ncbi:MAG: hypothetical protein A3I66_01390 [Burkholderiales bacterium RIFCSPLOWO2_02_FULL_57_36]|nr:MAG: hypothetical protein A3I66_01390 [Burkholderiales bacterium RIFCSPLOWO2_02_FULL_57_36]
MNIYSQYTYDAALLLEAAAAHTTEQTDVGATILDLGPGLVEGNLVIDVTAIDVASTDEYYTVSLEGSNVAAMTSGSVELAVSRMGNTTAPGDADTGVGRFVIPFRNEKNGTTYRYVRLSTKVEGTTPSITFSAWIAKD